MVWIKIINILIFSSFKPSWSPSWKFAEAPLWAPDPWFRLELPSYIKHTICDRAYIVKVNMFIKIANWIILSGLMAHFITHMSLLNCEVCYHQEKLKLNTFNKVALLQCEWLNIYICVCILLSSMLLTQQLIRWTNFTTVIAKIDAAGFCVKNSRRKLSLMNCLWTTR